MNEEKRYCQNCHKELFGEFCSSCGQRDKELHVPIKELAGEVLDLIPTFDERLLRSLKPFLMKPGFLTLEYLSGKRKQYISPFKLYFFISFIFFLVSSMIDTKNVINFRQSLSSKDSTFVPIQKDSSFVSVASNNSGLKFQVRDSSDVESVFGPAMIKALKKLKANPQLLFDKIKEHRPKIIFLLMPIFALLLKMLYYRSKTLYIKHLVFSFYFHSFIFFIFLVVDLFKLTKISLLDDISSAFYLFIPINLYFGMKQVYTQNRWKTFIKFTLISVSYVATFFIAIIVAAFLIIIFFY